MKEGSQPIYGDDKYFFRAGMEKREHVLTKVLNMVITDLMGL